MAFQASCPACGATVTFKTGSAVVVVCESCNSVVARTDRGDECTASPARLPFDLDRFNAAAAR